MQITPPHLSTEVIARRSLYCALACSLWAFLAMPAHVQAATVVHGQYSNPSGDGYTTSTGGLYVVVGAKSKFDGSSADGFYAGNASVVIQNGDFSQNGNVGFQNTGVTTKFSIVDGGSFDGNLAGVAVYTQLVINAGDYSGNSAYGAETHATTAVNGGNFGDNGEFDIAVFGGTTSIYGGTYAAPLTGQATFGTVGDSSNIIVYGTFDQYGTFAGNLNFSGTLAKQTAVQDFTYVNFGGSITLQSVAASIPAVPVPEAPTNLLFALGLLPVLVAYRRAGTGSPWPFPG